MERKTIIQDATQLLEPLSGLSINEVILKYNENKGLASKILSDPLDFQNRFLADNEHYITTGTTKLRICHNVAHQHGTGPVYVFIHGLGGTLTQFEPLLRVLDVLNEGFLAIDLPGFGHSDELDSYSMLDIAKIIREVLIETTKNKKVIVVGHSMGCHIALHFGQLYNAEFAIKDMVFLSPPPPTLLQLQKVSTRVALSVLSKVPFVFDWYRAYFDQSKGLQSSGIRQFFLNEEPYRKLWQFHNNVQIRSRSLVEYLRGWVPFDWSTACSYASVIVITGDADPVTPLVAVKAFYAAMQKIATHEKLIVINNCSHNICFDKPQDIVKEFLENVIERHG